MARSSLRAHLACEEGRGGDVDQLDDNYKLYFSFTVAVENKERSFSFTIAEENIHMHAWKAQKGMVWYYIESCSLGFVFLMIPSTRSDGEARVFRLIGTSMQRSRAWSVVLHRIMLACDSIRRRCTDV